MNGGFKGLSIALQGRFKVERLALVGLEGRGLGSRGFDRPAQGDGGKKKRRGKREEGRENGKGEEEEDEFERSSV